MGFKKFEDIIAWQKAQDLAVNIYEEFTNCKDFSFKDQIFRAVVSISNNIAEGFDRGTKKEFIQFLHYSRASGSEVRSMLRLAPRIKLASEKKSEELISKVVEVNKIIGGLLKFLKEQK
jgi:four helix bundle protein